MMSSQRSKKTVLVCEDDSGIRETIRHLLILEGYTVFVAENGRDGLSTLRQLERSCVVLLDIQMPEMDGYEFLQEKNSDPSIASVPVIVLSATQKKPLVGVSDFVSKPFEIPKLLDAVERYFKTGRGR